MTTSCDCGMTLEQPTRRADCPECGTVCCVSCVIEVEEHCYCRWWAPARIAV
jgi:hypothetical protein